MLMAPTHTPIQTPKKRLRLAAVITAYKNLLHGQHVVDRFLEGYGWNGTYHHPNMDVVSLYIDQRGPGDLGDERASRHPLLKLYPTIAETVTCGTSKLAVDGVVVVGEHGTYPLTAEGIMQHPHYEFFEQITKVYRDSGRAVPYFNDKELSYRFDWSKAMVDTSHELGFPLQGGSSLAVTWRLPSVEMPLGTVIKEAVSVGYGGMGSYDFHGLETIQCMTERRKGGETGVEWIQAYRGDAFWKAHSDGVWSDALMKAALCRSSTLSPGTTSFTNIYPTLEQMKAQVRDPIAYNYQCKDGLRCTMLLMNGLIRDFNFACQIDGHSKPFSTQMYLPMPDGRTTLASFFTPLVHNAEIMFETGKQQYPIERTLMTSGLLIAGVHSARQPEGHQRIATPELAAVHYQPNPESTFWRT
jgi:hypothetical protein